MKSRNANDTILGYFYQFDKTIIEILKQTDDNNIITIEGIEDIDVDKSNEIETIQCKYHEALEYNHSQIKKAKGVRIETQTLPTETLSMGNLWDKIRMAFISKITTEKINDVECYKISVNKEWQVFVNKNDLLVMREINGSTDTGIIEYKINEVRDEDVLMPNLAGRS